MSRRAFGGVRGVAAATRVFVGAVIVTLVPIAVAAGRAVHGGWLPLGDNAVIALRARDVLSEHPPLLGLWSSASLTVGTHLNHPGPLLFDWLAIPASLFDGGTGIVLGMALLNGLAVIGIAVLTFRRGGPLLATAAMAVTAALCWAMGTELLVEPLHAHAVVLPFLCYLMLTWSLACGDLVALPWAAVVGSLVAQTNVTYTLLVAALAAWGLVGLVLARRRERGPGTGSRRSLEHHTVRTIGVAGLVVAVCWVQPLVEQFTSDGAGNLTRLSRAGSSPSGAIGYEFGTRMFASVVSLPPWIFRPSFSETLVPLHGWRPPSLLLAAISLGALALVLGSCARVARRRRDLESSRALVTAIVGLLAGLVTIGRTPRSVFGIAVGHFRWLWPLAAFVLFAVAATCARRVTRATAARTWLITAFVSSTVVFAALNLPSSDQGTSAPEWPMPTMRALGRQLAIPEGQGTLLVDISSDLTENYYGTALLAELERRDVPFVVADAGMVRQVGPSRRFSGSNAEGMLFLRTGDDALVTPPGTRRVALHETLSPNEQLELADLEDQIREYLRRARRLPLTPRGREIVRRGYFPDIPRTPSREFNPDALVASRGLVALVQSDLLSLDARWAPRFERYAYLQDRWDKETAAVFLGPVDLSAAAPSPDTRSPPRPASRADEASASIGPRSDGLRRSP
jgi:hypothetical protein